MHIRVAEPARDAERIAEIYRPHVEVGLASFENVAPTAAQMADRITSTLEWTPWLVAIEDGTVCGYAYASRHRERAGYRWSVDVSVYIDRASRGRGVGRMLYAELLALLKRQGFVNVYAGITIPNPASVRLHESIGMKLIGVYEKVGFKFGEWPDVAWYGMQLMDPPAAPREPVPFPSLRDQGVTEATP
jgi:L-amino acid N-acyltransferase YncA